MAGPMIVTPSSLAFLFSCLVFASGIPSAIMAIVRICQTTLRLIEFSNSLIKRKKNMLFLLPITFKACLIRVSAGYKKSELQQKQTWNF